MNKLKSSLEKVRVGFIVSLPERFAIMESALRILQSHAPDDQRKAALSHLRHEAHAIAGVAETLGLPQTGQRAQSLQLFLRTIPPRTGIYEKDEIRALTRAFARLQKAAASESDDDGNGAEA